MINAFFVIKVSIVFLPLSGTIASVQSLAENSDKNLPTPKDIVTVARRKSLDDIKRGKPSPIVTHWLPFHLKATAVSEAAVIWYCMASTFHSSGLTFSHIPHDSRTDCACKYTCINLCVNRYPAFEFLCREGNSEQQLVQTMLGGHSRMSDFAWLVN